MVEPLVIAQQPVGDDVAGVGERLTAAFEEMKAAATEGRPIVAVLDDADLLGQGAAGDAAVAMGLLGMVRALAVEGAREGWQVNAVARRAGTEGVEEAVEEAVERLAGLPGITGQLIRLGSEHLGKALP